MKINSKHYILIIFAIAAIILSIFGYIVMYRNIITQAMNSSKIMNEVNAESEKKKYENDLTAVFNNTVSDRAKLSSYFIHEDKIVDFIENVEKIGTDSGTDLILSSINSDNLSSAKIGTVGHVKAHITVNGSWANVMKSLILIENIPYSLSMNNVRLDSVSGAELSVDNKKEVRGKRWNLALDIEVLIIK